MATCEQIRREVAVRQTAQLKTCRPPMLYYNTLPCDEQTVNCLLFPKDLYQREQRRLRELVGQRPGTPVERIRWVRRIAELVHWAISHTNIIDSWVFGGIVPADVENVAANQQHLATLDSSIFPRANEVAWSLSRFAAKYARPPQGIVYWPLSTWEAYYPWLGESYALDGWGYAIQRGTNKLLFSALPMFHDPEDFRVPVGTNVSGLGGGLGIMEASGARIAPQLQAALLSPQVRDALRADGVDLLKVYGQGEWVETIREKALQKHFAVHHGGGLAVGTRNHPDGRVREHALLPGADFILDYYAALATDVVETPYEIFVLFGLEKWSQNMAVWAQRGRINKAPDEFVRLARDISTARNRVITAGGFSIAAGIATLVNPIAGVIVSTLNTVVDLLIGQFGAVGGWNCPYPLTRRSAAGDCDFGKVIGPEALERAQRQAAGIQTVFQSRLTPAAPTVPTVAEGGVSPLLLGAGLVLAAGLGYYLLKE